MLDMINFYHRDSRQKFLNNTLCINLPLFQSFRIFTVR